MAAVDDGSKPAAKGGISQHTSKLGPVEGSAKNVPGQGLVDFELVSELGRGTYGVVHKVRSKRDGKIYCMKRVKCGHLSPQRQREVLMEVLMLRRLNHKHVIGYYTSFVEKNSLYIVMEYAANGDLQRVLDQHKRSKTYVPEKKLWRILYELAQALQHLHSQRVIHRDIKIVNVFLDENHGVKLGDLGVSRALDGEEELAQSRVGTPLYLAPELIKRQPYDYKADIWALGVLIYTMASLKGPFSGDNIYALGLVLLLVSLALRV
jgi:NIMA (never in mitosis gene a)-related kinase